MQEKTNVLVTGGAGYIGSHAALQLLRNGYRVTVVDDLSRGNIEAVEALRSEGDLQWVETDIGDSARLTTVLRDHRIRAVMHFAGVAYVGESVRMPLVYYRNNTAGSLALLEAMQAADVHRLVFSSSCATYGEPSADLIPIREDCPQRPISPYGRSKLMVEQMIVDHAAQVSAAGEPFSYALLRYFNVAGCDRRGRIGEAHDPETHLIPLCLETALGKRESVQLFGTDYDTPDGSCVRDYVHVEDVVGAHLAVLEALEAGAAMRFNIGTGVGYSVRQVIAACGRVTGRELPVVEGPRRPGDPPVLLSDPAGLASALGWRATVTDLDEMVRSAWNWLSRHPDGY